MVPLPGSIQDDIGRAGGSVEATDWRNDPPNFSATE